MFDKLKVLGVALAFAVAPVMASAVTIVPLSDGDIIAPPEFNTIYNFDETLGTVGDPAMSVTLPAGSVSFVFDATGSSVIPLPLIGAEIALGSSFSGAALVGGYFQWESLDGLTVYNTIAVILNGAAEELHTLLGGPNDIAQRLVFGWESLTGPVDVNVQVAAVPIPAAGFLLMGALGGLGFVGRRRKKTS